MQLFTTNSANTFRVFFNDVETNNMQKALNNKISIMNTSLCYYIEQSLPRLFKEFKDKRVMVLNIFNDANINAVVMVQNIKAQFAKPKEKLSLLRITEIKFTDLDAYYEWQTNTEYSYKVVATTPRKIKVAVLNMSQEDQMKVAESHGEIKSVCNIAKYILLKATYKIEKCFNYN